MIWLVTMKSLLGFIGAFTHHAEAFAGVKRQLVAVALDHQLAEQMHIFLLLFRRGGVPCAADHETADGHQVERITEDRRELRRTLVVGAQILVGDDADGAVAEILHEFPGRGLQRFVMRLGGGSLGLIGRFVIGPCRRLCPKPATRPIMEESGKPNRRKAAGMQISLYNLSKAG